MIQGNAAGYDYFIDCGQVSQSVGRAIFGAWVTICVGIVAACIRSMYRSRLKRRLFNYGPDSPLVSLWTVSPALNPYEVFEARRILVRRLRQGDLFFTIASLACVATGVINAASTTIANRAIESNIVTRSTQVSGVLATDEQQTISGAVVQITSRAQALDQAEAPLTELFDFAPDDTSGWVYVAEEWNNTWKGACSYELYQAVDLHVYPTNSSYYQDQIPGLGAVLPMWATVNEANQGNTHTGFYTNARVNGTGSWVDLLITYAFGTAPDAGGDDDDASVNMNISLANVLLHNVGRTAGGGFEDTMFKSDVHVAAFTLSNSAPGWYDQAYGQTGQYVNAATNVASLYQRSVIQASINQQPVVQPTARQMLRYWQAFMSVKDTQYPHVEQRTLSVSRPVVQIRLSVLMSTVGGLIFAVVGAVTMRMAEPRDTDGKLLDVPGTQLDWVILAASEYRMREGEYGSIGKAARFAEEHEELGLVVLYAPDGRPTARIRSDEARREEKE